ncbi:MAG: ABC transporter permease [Cyclobacteriaceae bacterium]
MIKSILIASLRNLIRNRTFSLINLIGLSISMSLSLLIIIMVREQYTFDNFHEDSELIYRVNTRALRKSGEPEPYASSPMPLGAALKENYTFVDEVVSLNSRLRGDVKYEMTTIPASGFFVDPGFFKVFNFPFAKGSPVSALSQPNDLVLSQTSVKKIFGDVDPMGKSVEIAGLGEFIVKGVLAEPPGRSHFDFDMLASTTLLPVLEKEGTTSNQTENWNNYYSGYNYIKLKPGVSTLEVSNALQDIAKEKYANLALEVRDRGYEFYLHPLSEITPGPILSNQLGKGMPELLLIFLGVLAGLVMIMACFNYTNLMIAKSLTRAREIGVRKINGATRLQVFMQFVGESVIFALLCLGASYLMLQWMKPGVMQLHIADEFTIALLEDRVVYTVFFFFAVLIGILAGLIPSLYLSSFQPLKVLKGAGDLKVSSRLTFRKILITTQFTFSVIFVIVVIVINSQVRYVLAADYGFNQDRLMHVFLQGNDYSKVQPILSRLAGVEQVGGVSHSLGTWADGSDDYKRNAEDELFEVRDFYVDPNYISNLQLEFLAGKNFQDVAASRAHVILNQMALVSFGFSDPRDAIGQNIYVGDTTMLTVIGVVKDFHFRPLNYQIGPLAFRYDPLQLSMATISYNGNQVDLENAIAEVWPTIDAVHPVEMSTMENEIDNAYVASGFSDVITIIGYVAFLAVTIACLGMLGMAMYTTQTRIKEIGLRKALGASVSGVVFLLSRSFLFLIGVGVVIGTPVAFFLSDLFISNYAYRITITPWMLLSGIGLLVVLGAVTISSQTIAVARRSPVKSLRHD